MDKEQILKGGYKQKKFDGKILVILFLIIALIVSLIINFSIINSVFKYKNYFSYINSLSATKTQKGIAEISNLNEDFEAWLTCDDLNINLPIVKTKTNNDDFYLTHDFNQQENGLGNPYFKAGYENSTNKCVMASCVVSTTFFGKTEKYSLLGNFKQYLTNNANFNHIITLETATQTFNYQVISAYSFDVNSNYYDKYLPCNTTTFASSQEFESFYNTILDNSAVNFNLTAEYGDEFITFFVTDTENLDNRIIVVAKKI